MKIFNAFLLLALSASLSTPSQARFGAGRGGADNGASNGGGEWASGGNSRSGPRGGGGGQSGENTGGDQGSGGDAGAGGGHSSDNNGGGGAGPGRGGANNGGGGDRGGEGRGDGRGGEGHGGGRGGEGHGGGRGGEGRGDGRGGEGRGGGRGGYHPRDPSPGYGHGPRPRDPDYQPGHPYPSYPTYPYDPGYDSGDSYTEASCSPEVKQKNVNVIETTVTSLLASASFADAKLLADTIVTIRSQQEIEARIAAYCALIGVDARVPSEIAEFVGARDLSPYITRAKENLELSEEQATLLVNSLSQNLLNNLNN